MCISSHATNLRGKKNVFVVKYNPLSQTITFVKNMCINVDTRVESLGLLEYITLGMVHVNEEFLRSVLQGTEAGPGSRVFIRRIFPIQDERDASLKDIENARKIVWIRRLKTHLDRGDKEFRLRTDRYVEIV